MITVPGPAQPAAAGDPAAAAAAVRAAGLRKRYGDVVALADVDLVVRPGPNVPMYNTKDFSTAPTSWSVIYDSKYKGQVTVPDNPIQIADAALYLKTHQPSLGITDPYELTQPQFQAAVTLLAGQRPLIEKYWSLASQEIFDFKNGNAIIGAGWRSCCTSRCR